MGEEALSYDRIPYRSYPYRLSSPEHLSSVAYLYGYEPALPSQCRVLEIGCAAGNNIIPAAIRHRDSRFVGIDSSTVQIIEAQRSADRLGLTNVEFIVADLRTFAGTADNFDFVIAHGVYSWIAPDAQDALLRLCRSILAPQGVAYVSYNCYPGWKTRDVLRDAMRFRVQSNTQRDPVGLARGIIDFMSNSMSADCDMRVALDRDRALIAEADHAYLFHDFLEAENRPLYLKDFIENAVTAGLRYLCDSRMEISQPENYAAEIRDPLLAEVGDDRALFEQYADFVVHRHFRQSLLLREDAQPFAQPFDIERINQSWFIDVGPTPTTVQSSNANLPPQQSHTSHSTDREPSSTSHIADLKLLADLRTGRVALRREPLSKARRPTALPLRIAKVWREFAALTRDQGQSYVVNGQHEPIVLNAVEASLMQHIDGQQTHVSLIDLMYDAVSAGRLSFLVKGIPVTENSHQRQLAAEHLGMFYKALSSKFSFLLE